MNRQLTEDNLGICTKLKYIFKMNQDHITSNNLDNVLTFHYSIPNVQKFGTGMVENGNDIESNKFLVKRTITCL